VDAVAVRAHEVEHLDGLAGVEQVLADGRLLAIGLSLMFSGAAVLSTTNVQQRQAGLAGGVMNTAMESVRRSGSRS
jgi:hypothetical protein